MTQENKNMAQAFCKSVHQVSNEECYEMLCYVRKPSCIPLGTKTMGFTIELAARFFNLDENRVRNAYGNHRNDFLGFSATLSSKALLRETKTAKSRGIHYGYYCEFLNGTIGEIAHNKNLLVDARGLLILCMYLRDESTIAKKVFDHACENEVFADNIRAARHRLNGGESFYEEIIDGYKERVAAG